MLLYATFMTYLNSMLCFSAVVRFRHIQSAVLCACCAALCCAALHFAALHFAALLLRFADTHRGAPRSAGAALR